MILLATISFIIFGISLYTAFWYRFKYCPTQYAKQLIAEGATKPNFEKSKTDSLYGVKKAMSDNPDMKAFVAKYPGSVCLNLVDTELIKEVLTNHQFYSKANRGSELNKIFNSKGITVAEGDAWKLHRRVLSEVFQYSLFNEMIPTILETTNDIIDTTSKEKLNIQVPKDIELITSEAVTRIFFGLKSRDIIINGQRASEEASAITKIRSKFNASPIRFFLGMWALNFYSDYRRLKKRMKVFRSVFGQKIQDRLKEIKETSSGSPQTARRRDLLEVLLKHRINHNNDPSLTLSDEEILDEFSVFFLAGKDTTSLLVSLSLYCIDQYPEWKQKLVDEINEKIKDADSINLDLLSSLDLMSAFINEVLRVYPPAPGILPRVANRDHKIGDFNIKKGFIVNTIFIANHYNPKYFDNPEKFDPTRWFKNQDKKEGWRINSYAYLPFSAGARNCIGKHLALIEAKVILIKILKHFDVKIEPGFQLRLGGLGVGFGPLNPIPVTLIPKEVYP